MMAIPQHQHTGIGRAVIARAAVCLFAVAILALPAQAQDTALRDNVRQADSDLTVALASHPSYQPLVDGIVADCGAKLPGDAKVNGFCHCAAVVTFSLWRSRVDGGDMLDRLNEYIQSPTAAGAASLLRYQNPDIYKSACEKMLGKS